MSDQHRPRFVVPVQGGKLRRRRVGDEAGSSLPTAAPDGPDGDRDVGGAPGPDADGPQADPPEADGPDVDPREADFERPA